MKFTYLDLVDKTIFFEPVMARNWFFQGTDQYSLFTLDETKPFHIPGYQSFRCAIEEEMAFQLAQIQKELLKEGLSLKVYDAYRPQKAVDFFTHWVTLPDAVLGKKYHYPRVEKKDLHDLDYLSRTSSHSKGTAIDVTLVDLNQPLRSMRPENFLGFFDQQSLDMGIGYLAFDEKSSLEYQGITDLQKRNRYRLHDLMVSYGFFPLASEFWHFYYKPERNKDTYYDFDITDVMMD